MTEPLAFILAVLGLLATPGPTNTLLAASGAAVGLRRSLHLIPAEVSGYLCSILALALVLGPVAQTLAAVRLRSPGLLRLVAGLSGVAALDGARCMGWRRGRCRSPKSSSRRC